MRPVQFVFQCLSMLDHNSLGRTLQLANWCPIYSYADAETDLNTDVYSELEHCALCCACVVLKW